MERLSSSRPRRSRRPRLGAGTPTASTFRKIIVMSSCCGAVPTNAWTSRSTRSRSSSEDRWACSSISTRQTLFAEEVVGVVHRLADAVGEEQRQVAGVQLDRPLDEQPLEHLAFVDVQPEHEAVRREHLDVAVLIAVRSRHVHQRRVSGARIGHGRQIEVDDGVGHGDEAARVEVRGDDAVGREHQIARRPVNLAERQHQALELRHVERRRRALARHVGDQARPAAARRAGRSRSSRRRPRAPARRAP